MVGLEFLASGHENEFVRAHAAGWSFLWRASLRIEQSLDFTIHAIVEHTFEGRAYRIASGATRRDKHPDPSKRRPRPAWAVVDGFVFADAIIDGLDIMHSGVDLSCILRDTDSTSGAPADAMEWISAPLSSPSRVAASLQSLLRLPEIGRSRAEAAAFLGHAPKRFLQNVCEASPRLSAEDGNEIGRFSLALGKSFVRILPKFLLKISFYFRRINAPQISGNSRNLGRLCPLSGVDDGASPKFLEISAEIWAILPPKFRKEFCESLAWGKH